jgi:hypothetical protein
MTLATVELADLDVPFEATAPTGRPHPKREQALALIRQGCSDHEVHRRLRMDREAIRRIRRQLAIPTQPLQPLSVEQKWALRARELPGGHLEWTGSLSTGSRTPILHYREKVFTAAAIAFRIRTGRDPVGHVMLAALRRPPAPGRRGDPTARPPGAARDPADGPGPQPLQQRPRTGRVRAVQPRRGQLLPPLQAGPQRRRGRAVSVASNSAGAGQVTLVRHGGGAGPDWGAYALLVTTVQLADGGTEAVIAAAPPEQVDPVYGLHLPRPYGPTGSARRPLWEYAAAATGTAGAKDTGAQAQALALYLLRISTSARISGAPTTVALPWALWQIRTEQHLQLAPVQGRSHGWGGFASLRVGRLLTVTPKDPDTPRSTR